MEQGAAYGYLLCWEVRQVLAHQATGLNFLRGNGGARAAYGYLLCWEVRQVLAYQATGLNFLGGLVVQEQPAATCHVKKCGRVGGE